MSMQTNTLKNYNNNSRKEKMNNKMNKTDSKINKEEIKPIEPTNENKEEDILEITDDNSLDNERNKDLNEEKTISEIEEKTNRNYITRDESWLNFNTRILDLSIDKEIPFFERLNFLSIASKNMDEFFNVRLPRLNSHQCLKQSINDFEIKKYNNYNTLMNELNSLTGYKIVAKKNELSDGEKEFIKKYFDKNIKALLTPIVADNTKPFPLLKNKSLSLGVVVTENKESNNELFAIIQIPDFLPRVIKVESLVKKVDNEKESNKKENTVKEGNKFILLEDIIKLNICKLFIDKEIRCIGFFRVLRNQNYKLDNSNFIVNEMKETLKRRDNGEIVKIESTKKPVTKIIKRAFKETKIMDSKLSILDLSFCADIKKLIDSEIVSKNSYEKFNGIIPQEILECDSMLDLIDDKDILLHHPYDSYKPVINFIEEAAKNKNVVGIKQTLYRVSKESPIMQALIKAAENGKQVTVVIESKARFDEANNLEWAAKLEKAGAQVIYGISDMKIHCKLCLVTAKSENGKLNNYAHIGTGNYNEINSQFYTDLSLFTSRKNITEDIAKLFNAITGFSNPKLKRILASPFNLKETLINNIDNEIAKHKEYLKNKNNTVDMKSDIKPGYIFLKMNGLTDKEICDKIYEAADSGVKVVLVIRSSCSLVPRKNLIIKSIIGRFLEHSRIWYFSNGIDDHKYYVGSSDLMPRNLNNRIEVMVPIDKDDTGKIEKIIDIYTNNRKPQNVFMKLTNETEQISNINKFHIN